MDPFCGTGTAAEAGMRQGKRFVIGDRDQKLLQHVNIRLQQRYEFLFNQGLLPPFYNCNEVDVDGDEQEEREIEATNEELSQVHWVTQIKKLNVPKIPTQNLPESGSCNHEGIIIKESSLPFNFEEVIITCNLRTSLK